MTDPKDHAVEVADPYDLSNLRLDQSFVESAGVKRLLTSVPTDGAASRIGTARIACHQHERLCAPV